MARKKKAYYELKNFLVDDQGFNKESAIKLADDVYDIWLQDESQNIMDVFNERMGRDLTTEGSPESEARGDDNSENQAKSSAKQEEETHDQNLEEEPIKGNGNVDFVVSPNCRIVNGDEPLWGENIWWATAEEAEETYMNTKKGGLSTSVPAKFDWEKYLEENPQFKTKDKDSGVEVLLLQFFKDIAHKEGVLSVRYSPLGNADQGYCSVSCEIEWPNLPRISSGLADAHFNNCHSFTKYYLSPMAENRSFIRAVKQYFNIPYLGKDEIGQTPKEQPKSDEAPTGPYVTLKKAAKDKLNIASFDGFKSFLRKQVKENPETAWLQPEEYRDWVDYNDWDEIKKPKILELIGKIKA